MVRAEWVVMIILHFLRKVSTPDGGSLAKLYGGRDWVPMSFTGQNFNHPVKRHIPGVSNFPPNLETKSPVSVRLIFLTN